MIEHTFFLPIFTAAIDEKYFKLKCFCSLIRHHFWKVTNWMKRQIGTVNLAKQATNMGVNLCKYFQPHCALLGGGGVKIGCCCTLSRNRPREVCI